MLRWQRVATASALACSAMTVPPAGAMPCAALALVLAVDGSGSIDDAEYALQLGATALALTDPEVVSAMRDIGGVAVAAVIWGDSAFGEHVVGWQRIDGSQDAARFARALADLPRVTSGNTDIGQGLNTALDLFDPAACPTRMVIDVSGDGEETLMTRRPAVPLANARARAADMGVEINGLAVTAEDPDLASYYAARVIQGPESFVIAVRGYAAFGEAMKRKLLREIGLPVAVASIGDEAGGLPTRLPGPGPATDGDGT